MKTIAKTISEYNELQESGVREICSLLEQEIAKGLRNSESKIWHGSPVWFMAGNPIVSYSVRKNGKVSLMFFSGQGFREPELQPEGKFKAAEVFYETADQMNVADLKRWLQKSAKIQWNYKDIVKNKGKLELLQI